MKSTKPEIPLLTVENLNFSYDLGHPVLEQINLTVTPGETIGLIGANGVGKSTLLRLLVGLELNFTGTITLGDFAVNKKNLPQIRADIGYVFQDSDSQLFTTSVYEDVAFGPRSSGLDEAAVAQQVETALELVGISHLKDRPIHKLSGGEKKLASLATVLAMTPKLLLFDEPSVALDPKNRRNLIDILGKLPQTSIIATHDLDLVLDCCSRVLLMTEGRLVADGSPREILCDKELLETSGLELPLSLSRASRL